MRAIDISVQDINEVFAQFMEKAPCGKLGIAVSGGSDSLALMYLTAAWAKKASRSLVVLSIDHGLRKESKSECKLVEERAKALNIPHRTVEWSDKPRGNLQKVAREARHKIIKDWAISQKLSGVLLGHTLDDNVETFILRLIRGSGVDGLAGISPDRFINGVRIFRPLLNFSRNTLQQYLETKGYTWVDDPSNRDRRFDRVKVRQILSELQGLGLSKKRLLTTANHMRRAQDFLTRETFRMSERCVRQEVWGGLSISLEPFLEISKEIQLRILSAGLMWVSGKVYKPRYENMDRLLTSILDREINSSRSLMGVLVREERHNILLIRDFSALSDVRLHTNSEIQWDGRWQITLNLHNPSGYNIGPIAKKGLMSIGKYGNYKIPKFALMSSVGLFKDDNLVCAPIISFGVGMNAEIIGGDQAFKNYLHAY